MELSEQAGPPSSESLPLVVLMATTGGPSLAQTLASLARVERPASFKKTYLVENGSSAPRLGSDSAVFPAELAVKLLHHPEANKSGALNCALSLIQKDFGDAWVFMTDDDGDYPPGLFGAYHAATARAPFGRYFGGAILPRYEKKPADWLLALGPPSLRGFDLSAEEEDLVGANFCGHNWMARLSDLLRAGGFREDRGPGTGITGQESAMMRDLRQLGLVGRWVPGIPVGHDVPKNACTPEWLLRRAERMGREQALLQLDGRPRTWWRVLKAKFKAPRLEASATKAAARGDERLAVTLRVEAAFLNGFADQVSNA